MPHQFTESLQLTRVKGFDIREIDPGFGKVILQTYNGNGYSIHYTTYFFKAGPGGTSSDNPVLAVNATVSDHGSDHKDIAINLAMELHEELYLPQTFQTFSIHYTASFLLAFTERFPEIKSLVDKRTKHWNIDRGQRSIPPDVNRLINSIIHGTIIHGSPEDARQYYEGLASAIIIKMLEGSPEIIKPSVNADDISKACEVRRIILSDFTKFDSLSALSRKVGTNATKLKVSFKQLTGKTVFRFSQAARLEYVKKLLVTTNHTIQTIAEMAGYTEGNNLNEIFRRTQGCTPGNYRKMKR